MLVRRVADVVSRSGGMLVVASDMGAARAVLKSRSFAFRVIDAASQWFEPGSPWLGSDPKCNACPVADLVACGDVNVISLIIAKRSPVGVFESGWTTDQYQRGDLPQLLASLEGKLPVPREAGDPADLILGEGPAIVGVRERIREVARYRDLRVLVLGETGTGKELVAQATHRLSRGDVAPFVAINCAAIPEELFESELFGHEAGAYTGARTSRTGLLEAAGAGTIFLDEIGDMPARLQPKLLRVLESRSFRRVGGNRDIPLLARVVSATNELKRLRSDLFYRLAGFVISLPPLRERASDIELLAKAFLRGFAQAHAVAPKQLAAEAVDVLRAHPWPGNVRELRAAVEYAAIIATDRTIRASELLQAMRQLPGRRSPSRPPPEPVAAQSQLEPDPDPSAPASGFRELERELLLRALTEAGGNRSRAAERLKLPRSTFRNKLARYGIR